MVGDSYVSGYKGKTVKKMFECYTITSVTGEQTGYQPHQKIYRQFYS